MKRLSVAAALVATLLTTGCPAATSPTVPYASAPAGSSGLGGLITDGSVSREEQELRDLLKNPPQVKFPVRLGIVFYGYDTSLKPEDQQALMNKTRDELATSGLVTSTFQIPSALVPGNPQLPALRKLAARFQVDVLLLLSGQNRFGLADSQPLGFFDSFSSKGYYESRVTLEGLALDVASGLFIGSFQSAGQDGPKLLDRADESFNAGAYPLQLKAESAAFANVKNRVVESLTVIKASNMPAAPLQ